LKTGSGKAWWVAKRIEYFDIRDHAKRSKDSGALEPDTCFQVGEGLSIAALIWQAFFAYFFGRLQKSRGPYGLSTMLGICENAKYSKEIGLNHTVIRQ